MYTVYWTVTNVGAPSTACSATFESTEVLKALDWAEQLRTKRREGQPISFVAISSEDPNCVGEAGVNDKLPPGYDWKKRRV